MKTILETLLGGCCASLLPTAGAEPAAVSFAELLKIHQEDPAATRVAAPLSPEWIGEIKRTHVVGDTDGIYQEAEPPRPLRMKPGIARDLGAREKIKVSL